MMRKGNKRLFTRLLLIVSGLFLGIASAWAQTSQTAGKDLWQRSLDTLVISAVPLGQIGLQTTRLDSLSLARSVSSSLADVLGSQTPIFIKSYGRGTLATASFRGTAPSHTQVTWNGMKMNSPMLGMVDFSMIPSYFVDGATLFHGASSVNVTGGALGGAVALETQAAIPPGWDVTLIQGVGSFHSLDEFARVRYGRGRWQAATRIAYAASENDFSYTNYRKKQYLTNLQGQIIGSYYPTEKNRNGDYHDLHIQQEVYYSGTKGWKAKGVVWLTQSQRGVPLLKVDYKEDESVINRQTEQTLRSVVELHKTWANLWMQAQAGYTYSDLSYIYAADPGNGELIEMTHSQSYVNTLFGKYTLAYALGSRWYFSADLGLNQHFVNSVDRSVHVVNGQRAVVGYQQARAEWEPSLSVKYRPIEALGLAFSLRKEFYAKDQTPLIPAFYADLLLHKKGNWLAKASVARNYRYPSLNDLYFMPGGNPSLLPENGFSYDLGLSFDYGFIEGSVTGFDSYINNWILWLPTFKGYWSPVNVKQVHSYGLESKLKANANWGKGGMTHFEGNFAWTRSLNQGDPLHWADGSIGKQLVYIPEYSGAFTLRHTWRSWALTYKWNYYSERNTTSSGEQTTLFDVLPAYFMNDLAIEKRFDIKRLSMLCKLLVNNLFDEEYESVLARPMPGCNFNFFLEVTF